MNTPDLRLLDDVVAAKVLDAMKRGSAVLTNLGIRHTIVGGLAVGAHGHPRATKDVDFLVGDEAFEHHEGGVVTMRPGVPIQIGGVLIDLLSVADGETHLARCLDRSPGSVIDVERLIYMKLKSPRQKDAVDVIELIKVGADVGSTRKYLTENAAELLPRLEQAVRHAAAEE